MSELVWGADGTRQYETGVDRAVLFPKNLTTGVYETGVAWSGLTAVTLSPSGAEKTDLWADNTKYGALYSAEDFGGTIEAYMYPPEFGVCNGFAEIAKGVTAGQQTRGSFGFVYRSMIGTDVSPTAGYKLHIVYNARANPSEESYQTINDSPEAGTMSWEFTTIPGASTALQQPTASITINSLDADPVKLAALEAILYGTADTEARLPLIDEVITLMTPAP